MLSHRYHIKKNDLVEVIAGDEKGKTGKVLRILGDERRVILEKINRVKKHTKPSQKNPQGGIVEIEQPIAASNVLLVCSKCNKGVRTKRKKVKEKSVRVCKKCDHLLDKK